MRFLYLLLLYVFCVCAEIDHGAISETDHGVITKGGIVKQYLEDVNTPVDTDPLNTLTPGRYPEYWEDISTSVNTDPLKTLSPDSHPMYLECSYEHNFESIIGTTDEKGIKHEQKSEHRHSFVLRCVQLDSSKDAYLFVFLNALPIDRLTVTSCKKDDVQQSIFPPRPDYVMGHRYGELHEDNNNRYILTIYLVYKDVSGEIFQRMYSVVNNLDKLELKDRKQKASLSGANCCDVLFVCWAPSKEFKSTVIGTATPARTDPLSLALINEPGTTKQLVCTVPLQGPLTSDFSFELICVKSRKNPDTLEDEKSLGDKFFAFVTYGSSNDFPIERFTVKSCIEDDIVQSIFPGRLETPGSTYPWILFKHANGKCYGHVYAMKSPYTLKWNHPKVCPSEVLGFVHPSIKAGSVMWLSCKGPTSASGEPKTLP